MQNASDRFGSKSESEINADIVHNVPENTRKSHSSVWRQFSEFLKEKHFELKESTSFMELNTILKSWASNMKKQDGTDYKEGVVKHMFNTTAKMLQDMYYNTWNIEMNPFSDAVFKTAREARDATRKKLQMIPEKRTISSAALTQEEYLNIVQAFDENNPDGLQKKFFFVASYELAWRGGEGYQCQIYYFKIEINNKGIPTNRIEYNPIFSKTAQGGGKKLAESKWLIENKNVDLCPVRLYHKFISKRGYNVKTDRMYLTSNRFWKLNDSSKWYKNSPVGVNEIAKWVKIAAEELGLDIKKRKISNHSIRSSAVSTLAKVGVGEQQLMKITGHRNTESIKSYLQLDGEHHQTIIEKMRSNHSVVGETLAIPSSSENGFLSNCSNAVVNNLK